MGKSPELLETQFGPVEYRSVGKGSPIVFFHGGQSNARNTTFDATFDPDRFRLIVPSRPGYGRTPLGGNVSASASAHLVRALLNRLGTGPAAILGVSVGARPALAFAALFPEMTRCLVLTSPVTTTWMGRTDPRYWPARILYNPRFERPVWAATRAAFRLAPRFTGKLLLRSISTRPDAASISPVDLVALQRRVSTYKSGAGFLADLEQRVPDAMLASIACPTLIQHSRNDASIDIEQPAHAQALIRGAELRLYDNALGHFLWLGPGSGTALADVRDFVARHSPPPARLSSSWTQGQT